MVEKGDKVKVHYVGKTEEEQFDSSYEKEPLEFVIGSGQIIPGFENALIGKEENEKVTVNIDPKQGYGEKRDDLVVEVKKSQMPGEVKTGQVLETESKTGQKVRVIVKEVKDDSVVIDGNHPLAGKKLTFDIEITDVTKKENL